MAAPLSPPRLLPSGDSAITVEFSRNIDDAANRRVLALDRAMTAEPVTGVTETVLSRGKVIIEGGKFVGKAGAGSFLKRSPRFM